MMHDDDGRLRRTNTGDHGDMLAISPEELLSLPVSARSETRLFVVVLYPLVMCTAVHYYQVQYSIFGGDSGTIFSKSSSYPKYVVMKYTVYISTCCTTTCSMYIVCCCCCQGTLFLVVTCDVVGVSEFLCLSRSLNRSLEINMLGVGSVHLLLLLLVRFSPLKRSSRTMDTHRQYQEEQRLTTSVLQTGSRLLVLSCGIVRGKC